MTPRLIPNAPLTFLATGLLAFSTLLAAIATATGSDRPFVWMRAGDTLTLDPHAINEGTTHALNHQMYEPLVLRDDVGQLLPALATSWRQTANPLVWQFDLRRGVTFHDGTPLTADDVLFSLNRALAPTSDMRSRLQAVETIEAIAPDRIQITTRVRDPLLPIQLTDLFIMSRAWAKAHGVEQPLEYAAGETTYASTHANGTGPFRLLERVPGIVTRLVRNETYWGWPDGAPMTTPASIDYTPVPDVAARIEALKKGAADFIQDVPADQIAGLRQVPGVRLKIGAENRVIFLGLSVAPTVDGAPNPLADSRLREAVALTVDRLAIQRNVMLGQSIPTAVLAPPNINGFPDTLDEIPPRDLARARDLVAAATATTGPTLTLDCPRNRYVSDAAICEAVARQLSEVGLGVTVVLRAKAAHFARVRSGQSQFYLLGWGVPTFDSAYIFLNLLHSPVRGLGTWNGTGFADAGLDRKIEAVARLTESRERQRIVAEIWQQLNAERLYVPLHVQTLVYAMGPDVDIPVDISNTPKLKNAKVLPPQPPGQQPNQ